MATSSASKLFVLSTLSLLITLCYVPKAQGFLGRGSMLEGYGDLFGVYCPKSDPSTPVWHHREIVQAAVKQTVFDYFKDTPPTAREYSHRKDMTLEEAYLEYYGPSVSPKRFLEAVEDLVDAAVESEGGELGYNPLYHFNNELFSQSDELMQSRWRRMVGTAKTGDVTAARYLLGLSLAALQDFYANSNWVELGNDVIKDNLGLPGSAITNVARHEDRTCEDCQQASQSSGCRSNLTTLVQQQKALTSDYIKGTDSSQQTPAGKCQHVRRAASSSLARSGIGKDLPSSCYSPRHDLHKEAARLATAASAHYLTTLRHTLKDPLFLRLLSISPSPALVLVVNTRPSSVEETNAIYQTLQKLEEQHSLMEYTPEEYILVPYGGVSDGVFRSSSPSDLLTQFLALTLQASRTITTQQDLLSAVHLAAHASPSGAHVYLLTEAGVVVRGSTLLQKTRALLQHKRLEFTPIVVSRTSFLRDPRFGISLKKTGNSSSAVTDDDVTGASAGSKKSLRSGTRFEQDKPLHESEPNESDAEALDFKILYSPVRKETTKLEADVTGHGSKVPVKKVAKQLTVDSSTTLYQSLAYLAVSTGRHIVDLPYGSLDLVSKLVTMQQYPEALLYRDVSSSSARTSRLPLDQHLLKLRIALHGSFSSARLTSPKGVEFGLQDDAIKGREGFTLTINSPLFSMIEVDVKTLTSQHARGEWSLSYTPRSPSSVSVSVMGVTGLDITANFYRADGGSLRPSLQRLQGAPFQDWRNFLDVVVTGFNTSSLREVDSVSLVSASSSWSYGNLRLATRTPRGNTYIRLNASMPEEPFVVVYTAKDDQGHKLVRQSSSVFFPGSSTLEFSRGREVWGTPGLTLSVPVTLTNTLTRTTTFLIDVSDVLNFPITLLRRSVTLSSNESVTLPVSITIPSRLGNTNFNRNDAQFFSSIQPRSIFDNIRSLKPFSNSLVVTATPSSGGEGTSYAVAHVIVAGQMRNRTHVHHQVSTGGDLQKLSKVPATNNHFVHHYELIWGDRDSHNTSKRMHKRDIHYSSPQSTVHLDAINGRMNANPNDFDSGLRFRTNPEFDLTLHPSSGGFVDASRQMNHPDPVLISRGAQGPTGFGSLQDRRPLTNYIPNTQHGFNSPPLTQDFQGSNQFIGNDLYPPVIESNSMSSCGDFLDLRVCDEQTWTADIKVSDFDIGLQSIHTAPVSLVTNFIPGQRQVILRYLASCCEPLVTIYATDLHGNTAKKAIGEYRTIAEALGAGGIAGVVLGCVALLILIILAVFFTLKKFKGKEDIELRTRRDRTTRQ